MWQRCGRYKYQKVPVHTTNPDHLVPSTSSLTDIPPLQVTPRYRRDDGFTMTRCHDDQYETGCVS